MPYILNQGDFSNSGDWRGLVDEVITSNWISKKAAMVSFKGQHYYRLLSDTFKSYSNTLKAAYPCSRVAISADQNDARLYNVFFKLGQDNHSFLPDDKQDNVIAVEPMTDDEIETINWLDNNAEIL